MKRFVLYAAMASLLACNQNPEPQLAQCRLVAVQESFQFLSSPDVILTSTTLRYASDGSILNMEVNSNASSKRASFSLYVTELPNSEKTFEYRYADGARAVDTVQFNKDGYRTMLRKRTSSGSQTIYDYNYDADGYPTTVVQRDNFGRTIAQAKWVIENKNLTKYQNLKSTGIYEDTEVYEYENAKINDRLYYIGNYHLSYIMGKSPKNILLKILKGKDVYEYSDYKYDKQGNIIAYTEKFLPNFDLPFIKNVKLSYEPCK